MDNLCSIKLCNKYFDFNQFFSISTPFLFNHSLKIIEYYSNYSQTNLTIPWKLLNIIRIIVRQT